MNAEPALSTQEPLPFPAAASSSAAGVHCALRDAGAFHFLVRSVFVFATIATSVALARSMPSRLLLLILFVLILAETLCARGIRAVVRRYIPLAVFVAGMLALQLLSGSVTLGLAVQVFFVSAWSIAMARWAMSGRIPVPRAKALFRCYLFLHFLRHFTEILHGETMRVFIARGLSAPHLYTRTGLRSLAYSLIAVLQGSLRRAERFYAAQWLKGLDA